MKMRFPLLFAGVCFLMVTMGCYHTLDGRSKLGMPFSRDRLESRYERPLDQVFVCAKEVLAFMGRLTSEDTLNKTLTMSVDNNAVWVSVDQVEPNITRVFVQVRGKGGGGNLILASEIDKQIALQLQAR